MNVSAGDNLPVAGEGGAEKPDWDTRLESVPGPSAKSKAKGPVVGQRYLRDAPSPAGGSSSPADDRQRKRRSCVVAVALCMLALGILALCMLRLGIFPV